ncbi:MAG: PIN domain-containing protein [Alphaproteobacteria bacterium]|nr:PIN domain-containing protein [Alphaproteobacteria bacterium]
MILIDVNLLLYAHIKISPEHETARAWLDTQLNGSTLVGMPWHSLLGFLRIATNPRMTSPPEPMKSAIGQMQAWLGRANVWRPQPTDRHAEFLASLLDTANGKSSLTSDAHLAALALEHGLTVCTADSDFARFQGVKWINPLRS